MSHPNTLKNLIKTSSLKPADQRKLVQLFLQGKEEDLEPIVEFFKKKPEFIPKVLANYSAKKQALINQDRAAWQQIIDTEIKELKALSED